MIEGRGQFDPVLGNDEGEGPFAVLPLWGCLELIQRVEIHACLIRVCPARAGPRGFAQIGPGRADLQSPNPV
ncbi:hypothetical protein GCM10023209_19130 [Roseibacterium beibuensis]|uniref:Uncharacterized protein n=1 Tax=[Roseibacterium] beibuensis TaxID=1193142 RepID=A0ABP9L8I3_9RHOB